MGKGLDKFLNLMRLNDDNYDEDYDEEFSDDYGDYEEDYDDYEEEPQEPAPKAKKTGFRGHTPRTSSTSSSESSFRERSQSTAAASAAAASAPANTESQNSVSVDFAMRVTVWVEGAAAVEEHPNKKESSRISKRRTHLFRFIVSLLYLGHPDLHTGTHVQLAADLHSILLAKVDL